MHYLGSYRNLTKSLSLDVVCKDADLIKAFSVFTQKKAFFFEVFHTHLLVQKKSYEKAVKLYGKDNDYNVSSDTNKVLLDAFGGEDRGTKDIKKITLAVKDLADQVRNMCSDQNHFNAFAEYESYKAVLNARYPIDNFTI